MYVYISESDLYSRLCVLVLFKGDSDGIKSSSQVEALTNTILPQAASISERIWAVCIIESMWKKIHKNNKNNTPIAVIELPIGCSAFGEFISLLHIIKLKWSLKISEKMNFEQLKDELNTVEGAKSVWKDTSEAMINWSALLGNLVAIAVVISALWTLRCKKRVVKQGVAACVYKSVKEILLSILCLSKSSLAKKDSITELEMESASKKEKLKLAEVK